MVYRIVRYGRDDEQIMGSLVIPEGWLTWAKNVVAVQPEDDGLGDYRLNDEQTRVSGQVLGFRPEPERFYYFRFQPADAA